MQFDFHNLPEGKRYEDRYGGWIKFFERIATTPSDRHIVVTNMPWSWVPLLRYLRCTIHNPVEKFEHCHIVRKACDGVELDRTMLEVLCCFRPETVDCLWKIDMQWQVPAGRTEYFMPREEFIVTNNGSYHREEVMLFLRSLNLYEPKKRKVVLVPCAADKPYPAPLHKAILDMMPADFYMANVTGVLGIVPQDLWHTMPYYDSGIPNQWRLFQIASNYFKRIEHEHVVVYCDFYAHVLLRAFESINLKCKTTFVLPPVEYNDYVNLLDPARLERLRTALYS